MKKTYEIALEISGSTAMWTRPDTGDCPVSYPAPTYSAVKGIFESVFWGETAEIIPIRTEICSPIIYHSYQTNYGGPLRKSDVMKSGGSFQLLATVLLNVCYKLYAEVVPIGKQRKELINSNSKQWDSRTNSPGHAYQAIFNRRLKQGQCFTIPFLGWKEFAPDYVGSFRDTTFTQEDMNMVIPSMLRQVFPEGFKSKVHFVYDQNVRIENGVLVYPKKGEA
ncbi:MAG: CRISPR-associated protein Cas5 [Candidatus Omnitrophica bacterium]|nr:CRISPR-associated protein Cas5 [Candidatus Omnitrophota bacterium]MBU4478464.1 CRISPR-associated protein Cas5 [Candidatus Omnitrophota bacterium]